MRLAEDSVREAANRTVGWLTTQIGSDGSLGIENQDLAGYYKLPYLMQLAGRIAEAHQLLDFISGRFLRRDGDFTTSEERKTADPVLSLYAGYINGWIAIAAHKVGRFEISFPAWAYLCGYHEQTSGGFTLEQAGGPTERPVELLMSAHLGMAALYLGDQERALAAGRVLQRFVKLQPAIDQRFYLRMRRGGTLQTEFPAEIAGLSVIDATQNGQAWFFIGYPMALLARLYRLTGERAFLTSACSYFDFARRCGERLIGEHFAHKVAWGAAELARVTGNPDHLALSAQIAERLIAAQGENGSWMLDQPMHIALDQSAEVAIWLLEIGALWAGVEGRC